MKKQTVSHRDQGMLSKLNKVFVIQLVFISLATIGGVLGAAKVVEDVLIKEALVGEAEFYWAHFNKDPDFPLPHTMNLTGYKVIDGDYSQVPAELAQISEPYQRVALNEKNPIAYVTEQDNERLILIFEEAQVSKLALYFGITPLVIVLLVIYLPAFISYVYSKRAISPIIQLVKKLNTVNVSQATLAELSLDDLKHFGDVEVNTLIEAFNGFSHRIAEFVKRERNFSRYASHELRTPLTVLKGSLALLQQHQLPEPSERLVKRMQPMVEDMQSLIEALLLLSREEKIERSEHPMVVNDLLKSTTEQVLKAFAHRDIELSWHEKNLIEATLPEQLFSIVIGNLVRNACLYSEDPVQLNVAVENAQISIRDNGKGMSAEAIKRIREPFYRADEHDQAKGFGLGLSIVDWLCRQCGWQINFESELGRGTIVVLTLDDVKVLA